MKTCQVCGNNPETCVHLMKEHTFANPASTQPYCIHCATYGHESRDCWAAPKATLSPAPEVAPVPAVEAPPGFVLVPLKPTEEMKRAGWIDKEDVNPEDIWAAMLGASPTAAAAPQPSPEVAPAEHQWLKCDNCGGDMRSHDALAQCYPKAAAFRQWSSKFSDWVYQTKRGDLRADDPVDALYLGPAAANKWKAAIANVDNAAEARLWRAARTVAGQAGEDPQAFIEWLCNGGFVQMALSHFGPKPDRAPEVAPVPVEAVQLWAVHVEGPDDIHPAASKEAAEKHAREINEWEAKREKHPLDPIIRAVVVPWEWGANQHRLALAALSQGSDA